MLCSCLALKSGVDVKIPTIPITFLQEHATFYQPLAEVVLSHSETIHMGHKRVEADADAVVCTK